MVLPRPAAFRASFASAFRTSARPAARQWQHVAQSTARRGYASSTGPAKQGIAGEMPWAIGAVAVTVPGLYLILKDDGSKHNEHGHGESKHKSPEEKQEERKEDPPKEGDAEKTEENTADEPVAGQQQEHEEKVVDNPEHKGDVEGVKFKGPTDQSEDGGAPDVRRHIPDPKGGAKKRIESSYGEIQGAGPSEREGEDKAKKADKAVASKEPGDQNTTSGKQAGLSNTDTKHSTDISQNPEKSKKGEGAPETAKLQGTVDPNRPMAEQKDKRAPENA